MLRETQQGGLLLCTKVGQKKCRHQREGLASGMYDDKVLINFCFEGRRGERRNWLCKLQRSLCTIVLIFIKLNGRLHLNWWPASLLRIFCGSIFAILQCLEPKILTWILLPLKNLHLINFRWKSLQISISLTFDIYGHARNHGKKVAKIDTDLLYLSSPLDSSVEAVHSSYPK